MDGNRFDDITRKIASGSSRRSFLKRSLAAAAGIAGIGQVAESSAARRTEPTPKPVSCPGMQIWDGSSCKCPTGTQCGPDCCQVGSTCCDNACCYGTCYGEELCCPTGQVVCNGVCLDSGVCCSDTDCGGGLSCVQGECICISTATCESLGVECGPATDNCGKPLDCGECVCKPTDTCESLGIGCGPATDNCDNPLDCGTCEPPYTCDQGHCTCVDTISCDGKCGVVSGQCGNSSVDCGNDCGTCYVCGSDNTCQPAEEGTDCSHGCTQAVCIGGACHDIHTIDCPPTSAPPSNMCSDYACVIDSNGPTCLPQPRNKGLACTPEGPCQTGVCSDDGTCVGTPVQCPVCHACTTSTCEPVTGPSCGDGFQCVDGGCYAFSGPNDLIDDITAQGVCASLKCEHACCPGQSNSTCCDSMDACFLTGGNGAAFSAFCCTGDRVCGSDCCESWESCVEGVGCRRTEFICADNPSCPDLCCGSDGSAGSGTCCSNTQRCHEGQCVEVDGHSCESDDECLGASTCQGLVVVETRPGNFMVVQRGVCCLSEYTVSRLGGYICCAPGTYPSAAESHPCCSWETRSCPSCTCSTSAIRGWRR